MRQSEIFLEGKRITLKWTDEKTANANAQPFKNKIILSKVLDKLLTKPELKAVLLHEGAHFDWYNWILPFFPISLMIIIFGYIFYNLLNHSLFFIKELSQLFVISLFLFFAFIWLKEILADRYAILRSDKGIFKSALLNIINYNKKIKVNYWNQLKILYSHYILHPPDCIRFYFIDKLKDSINKHP